MTGVRSEVGALRTVLVHRPGLELRRVTPARMAELLFDELLWVERAQSEHDAFTSLLTDEGVEVLRLGELLTEVLADGDLAADVVARHVTAAECGPAAVDGVRRFLLDLPAAELAERLVGGVTVEEVGPGGGLVGAAAAAGDLHLDPLPNAVFMRDSSMWIGDGVAVARMRRAARRREADLLRVVYAGHPRFADSTAWSGIGEGSAAPAVEGGDVLVVGDRGVAIGISERSTAQGVETLAVRLLERGVVDRVLAVDLPEVRSAMHLDTVVTQVDVDAFITYPAMTSGLRAFQLTDGGDGLQVREAAGLLQGLAWAAGLDHARAIEPALGSARAEREQWNDANNTLALRPGVVVAYERNAATNEILDRAGIDVRTIPSGELPRGRGGPRCMTCPVARDPVQGAADRQP